MCPAYEEPLSRRIEKRCSGFLAVLCLLVTEVEVIPAVAQMELTGHNSKIFVNAGFKMDTANSTLPSLMDTSTVQCYIPTYDTMPAGNNWVIHPSVEYSPHGIFGHKYWMAITPYYEWNARKENPSVFHSDNGIDWDSTGEKNPVVKPFPSGANSDPCLVYDHRQDSLLLLYRTFLFDAYRTTSWYVLKTGDGFTWTKPRKVWENSNEDGVMNGISPSILIRNGHYVIWAVSSKGIGSCEGIKLYEAGYPDFNGLTTGRTCSIKMPEGVVPWHIQVLYDSAFTKRYLMVIAAVDTLSVKYSKYDISLWLGVSKDGAEWAVSPIPLLRSHPGAYTRQAAFYRSSAIVADDSIKLWYNAFPWNLRDLKVFYATGAISLVSDSLLRATAGIQAELPTTFTVPQNYPNPFNSTTTIIYAVPCIEHVTLTVYNVLGERLTTLVDGEKAPGEYTVRFDGSRFSSGVYFYRIRAGTFTWTGKMALVK